MSNEITSSGTDLGQLETLAHNALSEDAWRYYTAFQEAFTPDAVLELIKLARRASTQPVSTDEHIDLPMIIRLGQDAGFNTEYCTGELLSFATALLDIQHPRAAPSTQPVAVDMPSRVQINDWMRDVGWQNSAIRQVDLPRVERVVQLALAQHSSQPAQAGAPVEPVGYLRILGDGTKMGISFEKVAEPLIDGWLQLPVFLAAPIPPQADNGDEAARDLERYRWIRMVENGNEAWNMIGSGLGGKNLDAAIDEAIRAAALQDRSGVKRD